MTDRREFLGAILAVFCGVALPGREMLRVVGPAMYHGPFLFILDETPAIHPSVMTQWFAKDNTMLAELIQRPHGGSTYTAFQAWDPLVDRVVVTDRVHNEITVDYY